MSYLTNIGQYISIGPVSIEDIAFNQILWMCLIFDQISECIFYLPNIDCICLSPEFLLVNPNSSILPQDADSSLYIYDIFFPLSDLRNVAASRSKAKYCAS